MQGLGRNWTKWHAQKSVKPCGYGIHVRVQVVSLEKLDFSLTCTAIFVPQQQ